VKGFRQRYDSPLSALSEDCSSHISKIYFASHPRVGWRYADGDGYRSREPINTLSVPFPILSAQQLPLLKRHTPHLYMYRLCGSSVSWVRLLGHRFLNSSRPMNFNKRREACSKAYWHISRSWVVFPPIFLNPRISPEIRMSRSAAGRRKAR
jgi:hypothetical protein